MEWYCTNTQSLSSLSSLSSFSPPSLLRLVVVVVVVVGRARIDANKLPMTSITRGLSLPPPVVVATCNSCTVLAIHSGRTPCTLPPPPPSPPPLSRVSTPMHSNNQHIACVCATCNPSSRIVAATFDHRCCVLPSSSLPSSSLPNPASTTDWCSVLDFNNTFTCSTLEMPNVTDIMEKSQSNIDKNPSERGKTEKKETFTIWHRSSSVMRWGLEEELFLFKARATANAWPHIVYCCRAWAFFDRATNTG